MHPLQTLVVNPLIRLAFRLGVPDPGDSVLETTGRRTGTLRLTPVCDGLEGNMRLDTCVVVRCSRSRAAACA
jgi:hypothetical protein